MPYTNAYLKSKGRANHRSGMQAEALTKRRLVLYGYRILKERYKTKEGEIDLVAQKDDLLVFCEVKSRKNSVHEAILPEQMKRVTHAALLYLEAHPECANFSMRFDAALYNANERLIYVKNAWRADDF